MKKSAGLLMYRRIGGDLEVFLVHPGGPFWKWKERGAWSIPKGEIGLEEDPLEAARREFREETGLKARGPYLPLGQAQQAGGKTVFAFAFKDNCEADAIRSNTFELEWPPHSGDIRVFPEIDKAAWFLLSAAREKINQAQIKFLDALEREKGTAGDDEDHGRNTSA